MIDMLSADWSSAQQVCNLEALQLENSRLQAALSVLAAVLQVHILPAYEQLDNVPWMAAGLPLVRRALAIHERVAFPRPETYPNLPAVPRA